MLLLHSSLPVIFRQNKFYFYSVSALFFLFLLPFSPSFLLHQDNWGTFYIFSTNVNMFVINLYIICYQNLAFHLFFKWKKKVIFAPFVQFLWRKKNNLKTGLLLDVQCSFTVLKRGHRKSCMFWIFDMGAVICSSHSVSHPSKQFPPTVETSGLLCYTLFFVARCICMMIHDRRCLLRSCEPVCVWGGNISDIWDSKLWVKSGLNKQAVNRIMKGDVGSERVLVLCFTNVNRSCSKFCLSLP